MRSKICNFGLFPSANSNNIGESGVSSNGVKFEQRQYLTQYLNQEDRNSSPNESRKGSYATVKSNNFNGF